MRAFSKECNFPCDPKQGDFDFPQIFSAKLFFKFSFLILCSWWHKIWESLKYLNFIYFRSLWWNWVPVHKSLKREGEYARSLKGKFVIHIRLNCVSPWKLNCQFFPKEKYLISFSIHLSNWTVSHPLQRSWGWRQRILSTPGLSSVKWELTSSRKQTIIIGWF